MKIIYLLPILFLGGCQTTTIGSVVGGECRLVRTPTYAVKGRTTYDQGWVDDTTEALVRGCKQARPKARPASLDAQVPKAAKKVAPAKVHWWQRL